MPVQQHVELTLFFLNRNTTSRFKPPAYTFLRSSRKTQPCLVSHPGVSHPGRPTQQHACSFLSRRDFLVSGTRFTPISSSENTARAWRGKRQRSSRPYPNKLSYFLKFGGEGGVKTFRAPPLRSTYQPFRQRPRATENINQGQQ